MMSRLVAVAAFTWLSLAPLAPGAAQSVDRIAFQARPIVDATAPWDIFLMNIDGSEQINLTNRGSDEIDPAWSPNGEKIAFASDRTGSFQVFVMNPDGSNQVQLTIGPGNHLYPAWSPDGLQLAYSSDEEGVYDIYVMQADGSDAFNVTQLPGTDHAPCWSPDGTMLAFSSDRDREPSGVLGLSYGSRGIRKFPSDIFVIDALGGAARNLTLGLKPGLEADGLLVSMHGFFEPSWSPLGQSIAFARFNGGPPFDDIGLLDAGGGGIQWFGLVGSGIRTPSWSRDGSTLAYADATFDRSQGLGIYVIPASGGEPTQLTEYARYALHPTWSPMSEPAESSVEGTSWGEVKRWFRRGSEIPEG